MKHNKECVEITKRIVSLIEVAVSEFKNLSTRDILGILDLIKYGLLTDNWKKLEGGKNENDN
jgi:hypothetical protein